MKERYKEKRRYYETKAAKRKRHKMKTLIIKGMDINSNRQHTNGLYAHGELEDIWGYDIVTAFKWGSFLYDAEDGIYDAKFICPNNTVVKAKVFIWCKFDWACPPIMQGLVVKVGDDEHMKDAKEKYDNKQQCL